MTCDNGIYYLGNNRKDELIGEDFYNQQSKVYKNQIFLNDSIE